MRTWRVITMVFCLSVPLQLGAACAQDAATLRLALVIGNAKYRDAEASITANTTDAATVATELKRLGYAVDHAEDTSQADLAARSEKLLRELRAGAKVVVYFNGYAIQSGRQNYLMPVDGNIWSETDVQKFGLNLSQLIAEISRRGASDSYLIVEGAIRNPYERRFRRFSTGLASVATLPPNTTLMLSAAPGTVLNPPTTQRGALATELARQLSSERDVSPQVLEKTRAAVASAAPDAPPPWVFSTRAASTTVVGSSESGKKPSEPATTAPTTSKPEAGRPEPAPGSEKPAGEVDKPPVKTATKPDVGATKPEGGGATSSGGPPGPPPAAKKTEIAKLPYSPADEKALADLDAVIARNPNDAAALYTRGQTFALHYDFAKALSDFDRVLKINPTDVESLNNRCWIKALIDDLDAAIADCNAALKLRPEFLDALDSRGFVMLKIGLPRRAIGDYDAALRINERHASALYGRGIARQRLGDKAPAERDLKLALSIDPSIGDQFSLFGVK